MFGKNNRRLKNMLPALLIGLCLATNHQALADSLVLKESKHDDVKCGPTTGPTTKDPDTGEEYPDCYQDIRGSYDLSIILSKSTLAKYGLQLEDIDNDTPLTLVIGDFAFSGTLSDADTTQADRDGMSAIWTEAHEDGPCAAAIDANSYSQCKRVVDTTIKMALNNKKGVAINLKGESNTNGNGHNPFGNGQTVFSRLCEEEGTGTSTDEAIFSVDGVDILLPLKVGCNVKDTPYDLDGLKGGPYDLINISIKARYNKN
jgi:hypothetical protein